MNVKPQIFQATKQTILKNKYEFIEIQLTEVKKRIGSLKSQNTRMKAQIKQLKAKPNNAAGTKLSLTNRDGPENNKENKCINLARNRRRPAQIQAVTYRPVEIGGERDEEGKQEEQEEELRLLSLKFGQEERERQKQLLYLEDYIKMLKKIWEEKQKMNQQAQLARNSAQTTREPFAKEVKLFENKKECNFFSQRPSTMVVSTQSLNESEINPKPSDRTALPGNSLNSSSFMNTSNQSSHAPPQPRRKTMSLSLNNSANCLMGFNFGKKSIQKKPSETNQIRFDTNCNSILSHSNSRTSISGLSHTGSSKSQMKRSEASKSYAKIVTKLKCKGCAFEFRPNQYYSHVEQCRDFLKVKLLEEKMKIDDEINQTLNLSLSESHF